MDILDIDDIDNLTGSNNLTALATYYWRELYKTYGFPEDLKARSIDLWYERMYYGRIDHNNIPIYPKEGSLKQLRARNTHFAVNFVADAWEDFRAFIEESMKLGNMNSETIYFPMEPQRSLDNIHIFYHEWNSSMYGVFSGEFLKTKHDRRIKNFRSFMKVYSEFSNSIIDSFPITRSALVTSKWCSPAVSGMVIEISDADHSDDAAKSNFIKDTNFNYIVQAARRYGFKVDKNAPWRFIADLDSDKMKTYMAYYASDKKEAHNTLYTRAYEEDLSTFKHYLVEWYNHYVFSNPYSSTVKQRSCDSSTRPFLNKREPTSLEEIESTIPESTWVRLYLFVKAKEASKPWHQKKFDSVYKRAMELIRIHGTSAGMEYIYKETKKDREHGHFTENPLTKEEVDAKIRRNAALKRGGSFTF